MESVSFDHFDLGGIEEVYESENFKTIVKCDRCTNETLSTEVHYIESFKHQKTDLIICNQCYNDIVLGKY